MVYEPFQDTAEVLETILNQPLSIPDMDKDITLLQAALDFEDATPEDSALNKILHSYLEFPESCDALVTELDILSDELAP